MNRKIKNEDTQTLYAFLYSVNLLTRDASDAEIIASWKKEQGENMSTDRLTPDEFACLVNDERFNDSRCWVRFIKM